MKTVKKYKCQWCGKEFVQEVTYDADAEFSSQVKCYCGNFIPTWDREETDNTVGRKHTHIRK